MFVDKLFSPWLKRDEDERTIRSVNDYCDLYQQAIMLTELDETKMYKNKLYRKPIYFSPKKEEDNFIVDHFFTMQAFMSAV